MRLLIIEDEEELLSALLRGFQKQGFIAEGASDGREGLDLARWNTYDVIVLDLNLPGMDGMEILREIRKKDALQKILILSARSDFSNRIEGLDAGANDYLVKPFDFGELEARVRSLLRRNFIQGTAVIDLGDFTLHSAKRRLYTKDGHIVELTPKEYGILEHLALQRGKPVSAEDLIDRVWEEDAALFSNALKVHISQIRKKMSAYSPREVIKNVRGMGYLIEKEGE